MLLHLLLNLQKMFHNIAFFPVTLANLQPREVMHSFPPFYFSIMKADWTSTKLTVLDGGRKASEDLWPDTYG